VVNANAQDNLLDRPFAGAVPDNSASPQPFYLPNNLVHPPVYAWDKPKTIYAVDALQGGVITHPGGTKIFIPAGAFTDAGGQPVEGPVQIDYREFHDPVDFLFSGIPMTYDSGGTTNLFESAGMFEITASQNGNQVFLNKDKPVKMEFVSTDANTTYNFYELNEEKGTWVNKGKTETPKVTGVNTEGDKYSAAVPDFLNHRHKMNSVRLYDSTSFADRFLDTAYYYTTLRHEWEKCIRNRDMTYYETNTRGHYQALFKLIRVHSGTRGEMAFKFKFSGREFPEMRAFSGKKWVITDKENYASFRQKYGYRNAFCDLRVETDGEGYILTLKTTEGLVSMHAYPISRKELEKKEHHPENTVKNWKEYAKSLNRREKSFNKIVQKDKKENNKNYIPEQRYWASLQKKMNGVEEPMTYAAWNAHCDAYTDYIQSRQAALNDNQLAITRSLTVSGMGIYNCDQVQRLQSPVVAHAKYINDNGKDVTTKVTYIIDNRLNGVLQYDGYLGYSPAKIAYSRLSRNILITVREDGVVAWADTGKFSESTKASETKPEFKVTEVDPTHMSVEEFRKTIGLK
ncbi:MAG TPA: hypothetical protein VNZ86_08930, partial [Bacteroidia bacterium]|nr:hypothetical protein [Bacteroidia bacterium]